MALEAVAGAVDYTYGGGVDYTPILYAKQMLIEYLETAVVPGITNHDYEGEIKEQGSEVIIPQLPTVQVEDHEKGAAVGEYEELSEDSVTLSIDYAKKWRFRIGSIDKAQAKYVLAPKFLKKAEYAMEMAIDTHVFEVIRSQAASANEGTTAGADSSLYNMGETTDPLILTKDNVLDWIADCAAVLSEQSVPEDNERFIVLPPWITNMIDKSELQNAAYSGDDESRMFKNRWIGELKGFNVHQSMSLYKATVGNNVEWDVMFGHRPALTFATQLTESDSLKDPQYFGMLYRGLQVYGFKAVKEEGLGHAVVTGNVSNG